MEQLGISRKKVASLILLSNIATAILIGVGFYFWEGDSRMKLNEKDNRVVQDSVDTINEAEGWIPFSSSYFNLSFEIPRGFEVVENQNSIRIAKSPYTTYEIGSDNAFFSLRRYGEGWDRNSAQSYYRESLDNLKESTIIIDGTSFSVFRGEGTVLFDADWFLGGKNTVVFFDASYVHINEENDESLADAIDLGEEILSTFRFSK